MDPLFTWFTTIVLVVGVVALALTVWALVDLLRTPEPRNASKLVWVILLLATNVVGVVLYVFLGRPRTATAAARR